MPSNLDLDSIKRDLAALDSEETLNYMVVMSRVAATAPALIAEVERLRQESADFEAVCMSQEGQIARLMAELATAKRMGAAEELERLFSRSDFVYHKDRTTDRAVTLDNINKRAAELRAEVGG
jgi:hypothetical protein